VKRGLGEDADELLRKRRKSSENVERDSE